MITSMKGLVLAGVAAAMLPLAANATPIASSIAAPGYYTFANTIQPGEVVEYEFTVVGRARIDEFTVSGTGKSKDVADVTYGLTPSATNAFTVVVIGTTAFGGGFVPGTTYADGDVISFFFNDGVANPVSTTLSFTTATVPLPAAGGLLMLALAGTGAIAARKKKKSA